MHNTVLVNELDNNDFEYLNKQRAIGNKYFVYDATLIALLLMVSFLDLNNYITFLL